MEKEILKLNDKYNIFLQKDLLSEYVKENKKFQLIKIKDDKNIIKLKKVPVLFAIEIDNDTKLKKIIKKLQKIFKKINRKKLEIGITKEDKIIIGELIISGDNENNMEIIKCIKAMLIKEKEKRIEYIYDQVCKDLDEEFEKNNYCDFKEDVCIGKRNCEKKVTMGCCHKFKNRILMTGGLQECPYLINKRCVTQCITCKLFTCDAINVKFRLKDIPLIKYFFNPIQKLIVKISFFTRKEEIIKKLLFFS